MSVSPPKAPAQTSIVDNLGENTLYQAILDIAGSGRELCIATAFFSLDALNLIGEHLHEFESVRLLFGSDANPTQRNKLLAAMRERSDQDLLKQRADDPLLTGLKHAQRLIDKKKLKPRVYTRDKFHAKAYLAVRPHYPPLAGILGSGNFTRPGLTQNIELNARLTDDQAQKLKDWYEERWLEAEEDEVLEYITAEVERQVRLYEPRTIFHRALLTWGDWVQGREELPELSVVPILDPHQEDAYRQALRIISRENGVLICDGVGLGKSFVAIALMEHYLSRGKRAFLIAPKAIITSSWEGYLKGHLGRFSHGYKSLVHHPMTWFGFDPEKEAANGETLAQISEFSRQAEVVVIDESHNFRKTDRNRYLNLLRMLQEGPLGKKIVILLTATPLNTDFTDLSAQFRLITQEKGLIAGIPIEQYQRKAAALDIEYRRDRPEKSDQLELDLELDKTRMGILNDGLDAIAIQRSRKTCKQLATARGKELRFPEREDIATIDYELSQPYKRVIQHATTQFRELAQFLRDYRAEVRRASKEKDPAKRVIRLMPPERGLRFSAYLTDRFRRHPDESLREAQVESTLVSLVFTNVMKQLESSPVAFQGILQALGAGLCARLRHTADRGFLPGVEIEAVVAEHSKWIATDLKADPALYADDDEDDDDGVSADASGAEMDDWLTRALAITNVRKGLAGFGPETHDVKKWRKHIEGDLDILRDIHDRAVKARAGSDDQKFEDIQERVAEQRKVGRKVLIFTQSKRTAEYIEGKLRARFGNEVARVDAGIQGKLRERILHSFSPRYNPMEQAPLDFQPVNILVSTDVLSEGVNLQEAGCILNYDIHWNPVRLIQRIGRVDRRLSEDDPGHTFAILNVVPPPEIEEIIELVGTVEGRKRKIIAAFGLDQSFFTAQDPAGTLREFNAEFDGVITDKDEAISRYDELITQHDMAVARAEAAPPGAFGVWKGAPHDGACAVFRAIWRKPADAGRDWKAEDSIPPADLARFGRLIGEPIFTSQITGAKAKAEDPATVLKMLAETIPNEKSGSPGAAEKLQETLKSLRSAALASIPERTQNVGVELVCWLELRPT